MHTCFAEGETLCRNQFHRLLAGQVLVRVSSTLDIGDICSACVLGSQCSASGAWGHIRWEYHAIIGRIVCDHGIGGFFAKDCDFAFASPELDYDNGGGSRLEELGRRRGA